MKKKIFIWVAIVFVLAFSFTCGDDSTPNRNFQQPTGVVENYSVQTKNEIFTLPEKTTEEIDFTQTPVIENQALPESSEEVKPANENLTCTLSIKCDTILDNLDKLDESKKQIIPGNGVVYSSENIVFYDGESVFNVMSRVLKQNKIHFEFEISPIYETAYIRGIANIYEFDCGELSGWIYKVNGQSPGVGVSSYMLKNGDNIELLYTCALGKDL